MTYPAFVPTVRPAVLPRLRRAALGALLGALPLLASALTVAPYSAQALAEAQKAGQPVAVHFHASWCPTCRAQDKVFESLKKDPALNLTLLQADYDTETALKQALHVTAQSTVIVWRGTVEKARAVGQTDAAALKTTLQSAL